MMLPARIRFGIDMSLLLIHPWNYIHRCALSSLTISAGLVANGQVSATQLQMPDVPTPMTKRAASHSRRKQTASAIGLLARPIHPPFTNDRTNSLAACRATL